MLAVWTDTLLHPHRRAAVRRTGNRCDWADLTWRIGGIIMIGLRELAILAVVVLVLYGRSGVLKSRQFQTIWPWLSPQRRMNRPAGPLGASAASRLQSAANAERPRLAARRATRFLLQGNRLYWFLTILAATAIASVIVGRMMIASGAGPGFTP
jgi:hypothetical protein